MAHKISRNDACQCGSGRKYKNCCLGQNFDWTIDDDGEAYRHLPISEEMLPMLQMIIEGREAGVLPSMEWFEHQNVQAMTRAGIHPAIIHAHVETQLLTSEVNIHCCTGAELDEWHAYIDEYEAEHSVTVERRYISHDDMQKILANGPKA